MNVDPMNTDQVRADRFGMPGSPRPARRSAIASLAAMSLCALTAATCGATAMAQDAAASRSPFQGRTLKIIVPNAPGGTSDILARTLAPRLATLLEATVVVENKAGATGNIGADFVAKARPDGLTVLLTDIGSLVSSPSVFPKLPFDPIRDFAPVALVAYSPHLLALNPDVPANTVRELVDLAKSRPDPLNLAVSGIGGANHLAGIDFAMRTGIRWTELPYKGGSQAIADVMAGQAQVLFNGMLATWPSVRGGKLKAIAISSAKRWDAAPDIPTIAEAGLAGFESGSYQGVVAPARTPAAAVEALHDAIVRSVQMPEVREQLAQAGAQARPGSTTEFGEFMKREKARWADVIRTSGAKFD